MTPCEIRELRKRLGLAQHEFAEKLGVTQSTVSRLEAGEWEADGPVAKLLERIAADIPAHANADAMSAEAGRGGAAPTEPLSSPSPSRRSVERAA